MNQFNDRFQSPHQRIKQGNVDPESELELTFHLKPQTADADLAATHLLAITEHPINRPYITAKNAEIQLKAADESLTELKQFLALHEIKIKKADLAVRKVIVNGVISQFEKALKIKFNLNTALNGNSHLGYEGILSLPETLTPHITEITGLENGLTKGERSRIAPTKALHANAQKGYSPTQIATAYSFPENDAKGECIGLVELGGTYKASDIAMYCKTFGVPVPQIVEIGQKPTVNPATSEVNNLEITLDIQMVAGLAPNAKIVIYYANSIPEALQLVISDKKNNPSVVSVSWAVSESDCSAAQQKIFTYYSYQAALQGITIVAASGDYGAYNSKNFLNVMLPASNPYVLACGGTQLTLAPEEEVVWYEKLGNMTLGSGGGYSAIYPLPQFQTNAVNIYKSYIFPNGNGGAGTPDISANSSEKTPYSIVIDGKIEAIGAGTSASTPVWASLIARLNKKLGYRLGWVNPLFYKLESQKHFKQIWKGNNGYYPAGFGWNPATGLGAPIGTAIYEAILEEGIAAKKK